MYMPLHRNSWCEYYATVSTAGWQAPCGCVWNCLCHCTSLHQPGICNRYDITSFIINNNFVIVSPYILKENNIVQYYIPIWLSHKFVSCEVIFTSPLLYIAKQNLYKFWKWIIYNQILLWFCCKIKSKFLFYHLGPSLGGQIVKKVGFPW